MPRRHKRTAMVAHEFRYTPQRRLHQAAPGATATSATFNMCTIELFLDRYVTAQPRALTWQAYQAEGGGLLGALGSHYIDGLRDWFGEVASVPGQLSALRPDVLDEATGKIVQAETDDTFSFTLELRERRHGHDDRIVRGHARARHPHRGHGRRRHADRRAGGPQSDRRRRRGREPQGRAVGAAGDAAQFALVADARDHRLMAFRMLVRDFDAWDRAGTSPSPNFTDGWRCQQVLDAVRESSATGRTVKLA